MILAKQLIDASAVTWSVLNGSMSGDSAQLTDRSPQSRTRMYWSAGTQTTASTVSLVADCDVTPRVVALLGITLPPALKVELWGKRTADTGNTYNLGGNSQSQDTVTFDDGSVGIVWVLADALDQVEKLEFRFFNDVAGAAAIVASTVFEIGEVVIGNALALDINTGGRLGRENPSKTRRTRSSQIDRVARTGYRKLTVTPCVATQAETRGGALDSSTDWQQAIATLSTDPYVLAVVDASTNTDIQRTAIFGLATKLPDLESLAGTYYGPSELVIEEIPA